MIGLRLVAVTERFGCGSKGMIRTTGAAGCWGGGSNEASVLANVSVEGPFAWSLTFNNVKRLPNQGLKPFTVEA